MVEPVVIATVNKFACFCGFQSEGQGVAPDCTRCGKPMHTWGARTPKVYSSTLVAEAADKRTENGGY